MFGSFWQLNVSRSIWLKWFASMALFVAARTASSRSRPKPTAAPRETYTWFSCSLKQVNVSPMNVVTELPICYFFEKMEMELVSYFLKMAVTRF